MAESSSTPSPEFAMPTAGEHQQRLTPFAGKFRSTVKIWMGPGEPMISTGTMTNTLELNGLYLQQDYVGDPNDGPFPSFAGKGFWGFNPHSGNYEGFWIDNASSMMQLETGTVDSSGKIWEMHSSVKVPPHGEPQNRLSRITLIDANRHKMESFFTAPGGRLAKGMEIDYERIK